MKPFFSADLIGNLLYTTAGLNRLRAILEYSRVPNNRACSNRFYFVKNHPGRGLLGTAQLIFLSFSRNFLSKITRYVTKLFSYEVKCIQKFCFIALWSIIRPCSIKFLRYFYTMVDS